MLKRRHFIARLSLATAFLAIQKALAETITRGACGAKCDQCKEQKKGNCAGCGTGKKAKCIVFRCNSKRRLENCGYCDKHPCKKHKRIDPPRSALS